jgi:hypothetical protein
LIEAGAEAEQSGFAAARRAHDRAGATRSEGQADVAENRQSGAVIAVRFGEAGRFQDGSTVHDQKLMSREGDGVKCVAAQPRRIRPRNVLWWPARSACWRQQVCSAECERILQRVGIRRLLQPAKPRIALGDLPRVDCGLEARRTISEWYRNRWRLTL